MQKMISFAVLLVLLLVQITCVKIIDTRESVIGTYKGIGIHSYYEVIDTMYNFRRDTSEITIHLIKVSSDDIIELLVNNALPTGQYLFKYSNSTFTSLIDYHPPSLKLINDTLYFTLITGKTPPDWLEAIARKTN